MPAAKERYTQSQQGLSCLKCYIATTFGYVKKEGKLLVRLSVFYNKLQINY